MSKNTKFFLSALIAALVVGGAFVYLTRPDDRNAFQKVGDAAEELPNGIDNAGRELEDRTPGERIVDDVKDATDTK